MIRKVKWRNDKNSSIIQQSFISDRKLFYTKVVSKWPIDVGPYPMNLYHNKNLKFGGNELSKWGMNNIIL